MKLTKTKICGSLAVAATIAVFSGCGDESTTNNIDNTAVLAFDADSLPECAKANEGELAFNKTDNTLRICYDTEWYVLNGKDGQKGKTGDQGKKGETGDDGTGCTVKALDDKSGLKLICDGDSLGVVLNGEQGEQGDEGNSCVKCEAVDVTEDGYSIKCGGEVVATILNGSAVPATKSSDSKQTSPASSSSNGVPVEPASSSSNGVPVEPASSSNEVPPAVESSSSHFSTTYDKTKLPLNFNELLTFFTVNEYTQEYVESGDYYNHTWSLSYTYTAADNNTDDVNKIINSAAKGSGVFETEFSFNASLGLVKYHRSSDDQLFSIAILYSADEPQSYEIKLTHHEYISEPVTPVTESSSSEEDIGNCPEGTSSPSGYSATVFPDGFDLLGKSPTENISITEATYLPDCDMDFGNSNFINTWSVVYKPTGTTTQDYDELKTLRLTLDSQATNNGFRYSSASNYNGVLTYYYTKDDGSSVTMKLNETTVDLTVELIYIEQLSGEPSQPAPTQSE